MSRKSKREIERALEAFDDTTPTNSRPPLDEVYSEAVARTIQRVARDLHRIRRQNPETIVNAPVEEATSKFLSVVRDRYGIDENHDDAVRRALEESAVGQEYHRPVDQFAIAPVSVAKEIDVEPAAGDSLTALVNTGREDEAERLLVRMVYDLFADRGGLRSE